MSILNAESHRAATTHVLSNVCRQGLNGLVNFLAATRNPLLHASFDSDAPSSLPPLPSSSSQRRRHVPHSLQCRDSLPTRINCARSGRRLPFEQLPTYASRDSLQRSIPPKANAGFFSNTIFGRERTSGYVCAPSSLYY